ncbi:MAG: putative ABC transporter permease [Clostridia bacterium]
MDTIYIAHMLSFILLYSFAGWLLESISKTIEERQWVNSGFLNGPVCPIYGLGAAIMILGLSFLKENPVLLFIVSFFLLSIWEYVVGIFLEKVFKTKYWDYSHLKFNIQGRVCLKNSIYWGILGVLFIRYIHPFIEARIAQIPMEILIYVNIILYSIFIVDIIFSVMTMIHIDTAWEKVNELGESIKEKLEELKNEKNQVGSKTATENIEKLIRELKIKQTKLKIRMYRQARRLKLAFPSMKSETITQFLNEKIDLEALKKIIKKEK